MSSDCEHVCSVPTPSPFGIDTQTSEQCSVWSERIATMILTKCVRLRSILLALLLLAISAAQAADVKQVRLPDYDDVEDNDDDFEGTVTNGQGRDTCSVTTSKRRGNSTSGSARLLATQNRRPYSTILQFSGTYDDKDSSSRVTVGKSLRMTPQSRATTNDMDNLKLFVPSLQQANLTAIQEQQHNDQESDLVLEREIRSLVTDKQQPQHIQNVSIMIAGLAIAVGSSAMAFLLGTTATITTSFPQFNMSPSLAIIPWMWSLRKRPTTGGFMLELMAVAELVVQHPAWYLAQSKVALSVGFNVLQQFIIWEFWRQVWRVSGRLFLNQVFHRYRSSFQKNNGNRNDENCWMNYLPMWMQRSIDYGDATLRRGAKKWLQKSVEKAVEANAVSWFVKLGEVMSLSLW